MRAITLPNGMNIVGDISIADEAVLIERGNFAKKYAKETFGTDKIEILTITQVLQIREQDGWKTPDISKHLKNTN